MDIHVKEFYRQYSDDTPNGNFHRVIALHEAPDIDWENLKEQAPDLSKGWCELARLPLKDRIEFIRDYWMSTLPYHPFSNEFLTRFFASLDDIGVFLAKKSYDDPFESHIVYSLNGNSGFFRGGAPADEKTIQRLCRQFPDWMLPPDYLAFLRIHNGFWKTTDSTGLMSVGRLIENYSSFQENLMERDCLTARGKLVDPKTLLPFYESFGMPFFQCFWKEWFPLEEVGNVYFSGSTCTISDAQEENSCSECMAFPTFTDWLFFYLERDY